MSIGVRMPAAPHQPVLLRPALGALAVAPGGCYVDATYGRGGHSAALLAALGVSGRLIGLDQDPEAEADARALVRADARFGFVRASFADLAERLAGLGLAGRVDGVLFDLGVSSPQFDSSARGFSFSHAGPLDMRMNPDIGVPVSAWLHTASHGEIASVLKRYGEQPAAGRIAAAIVAARRRGPITDTGQLAALVAAAVPAAVAAGKRVHPATRTFQALRIFINDELAALDAGLTAAVDVLAPSGRLAVIAFHSLEDRLVKRFMRAQAAPPPAVPMARPTEPALRRIGKPARASAAEIRANPRARSAIMRVAERTGAPRVPA